MQHAILTRQLLTAPKTTSFPLLLLAEVKEFFSARSRLAANFLRHCVFVLSLQLIFLVGLFAFISTLFK
jgi:hypothetical protein